MRAPRYRVISFAGGDPIWSRSATRLYRQARGFESVASMRIHGPESLFSLPRFKDLGLREFTRVNKRGFGYWIWKPLIIASELRSLPPELDGVVWLDVGCTLNLSNPAPSKRWISYQEESEDVSYKFFRLKGDNTHSEWTKKQAFDHFQEPNAIDRNLFTASAFFVSKSKSGLELVESWLDSCLVDQGRLLLDSMPEDIELESFREHRHDQSLISMELETRGYLGAQDETYFPKTWSTAGAPFPIWTTRLRSGFQNPSEAIFMKCVRRAEREIVNRFGEFNGQNWRLDSDES